ncbi:HAD family hydrolase [Adhaeribacter aquaticus]|uniref:HAD family hydrolase n=1 Tax=Adhaeribacter aquaticus TaxID=299567 RepID=UPI00041E3E6C|nr:HAD family phosphatase [Adhaeribacter aquaticus]
MKEKFAVLFDMDGVIIDSNPYHKSAWVEFCKIHQIDIKEEELGKNIYGKTNKDALKNILGKELSAEESDKLGEEKEALYRDLHGPEMVPVKGLINFLEELKKNNVATAVATNAPTSNVDFILHKIGVRHYFDAIIDAKQVKKGKPDPEIYLKAAEMVNISSDRCIVMEDSTTGVEAGLKANMKVVGITTTHTAEELSHTHLVINDFDELSVDKLADLLQ